MLEGVLLFILVVLAVPFFIGFAIGKSSSKKVVSVDPENNIARIQGQAEVRDYLLRYLSTQPATLKKIDLLHEMGVDTSPGAKQSYYPEPAAPQEPVVAVITAVEPVKDENQSVNVILYVASFLLVAAAVLFIGTNVPDVVKVVSAWIITFGFYAVGLFLHANIERLKPAAVAFVGTGLALLPFAGLATHLYVFHNAELSWFLTSLIGLGAFLYATLKLRSQVLAYLTLGFVFSLSVSSAEVLQAPLVWSFVVVIVVAALLNFFAYLKPKILSPVFLKPVDQSGQLAVPLAIFGSFIAGSNLELWQHGTILAVAALHYSVAALQPVNRQTYIFVARVLASLSILVFVYDYWDSWQAVGYALTAIATLHIFASALLIKIKKLANDSAWLWIGMTLQVVAIIFWNNSANKDNLIAASLGLVIITSILVSLYLKRSRYASFGVGALALLQIHLGKNILVPPLENYVLALLFTVESAVMLVVRFFWCRTGERLNISASACVFYGIVAIIFVVGEPSSWQALVFLSLAFIATAASYVEKEPNFYILTNILLFIAIYAAVELLKLESTMHWLTVAWISGSVFYAARVWFNVAKQKTEENIMMAFGLTVLFSISFIAMFGDEQVMLAASTLVVASGLLAYEGHRMKQRSLMEAALLVATFALQRMVSYDTHLDGLVYTHWWAITLAFIAIGRYSIKDKSTAFNWLIGALLVFSVPTGFAALDHPEKYQLLFLFEHIGVLTLGGLLNYRLITLWGAGGVALGVLYWLQDYTYLLVGLAGFGLILFAVWRLLRK